ncbi:PLC-like phosphodiesterase [Achaetomium macrosporum]|uniref:PLC-like phosphodiesterase n=1 Tax=Achaetomium macrosporum TaxID=79813 RepID=A0AAN7C2T6_9PEZI|nr:PLC-like phosphodiesterase [Achaetomium macrosporum]
MPSKGVHAFTYIAVPGCSIELSVPGRTVKVDELNRFSKFHLEVEAREIDSFFDKRGRFTFKVFHHGNQITEQWIDVNALTGNASGGTMESIANQRSIVHGDAFIICYGLYEAGDGHDLLPAQHQCYITVAPNYADWMRSVAPPGSDREDKPFSRLVLPAAHDVGMNSMASSEAILGRVGGAVVSTLIEHDNRVREVLSRLADALSGDAIALVAPNIIFSLAITQKDSLATMLQIGARYFEFRPAHLHRAVRPAGALPDRLYFQHSAIPGMAYDAFLRDVVAFLRAHPAEIVVVQLRWDGVPLDVCAQPSDDEKRRYLDEALRQHGNGEIVIGGLEDMKRASIAQLRRERKRLIMLDSVDSLSTYTDEGNATLNGDSIVEALPRVLTPENQRGKAFVNIQCQATASNIPRAVVYSVLEASVTTSCLLATKGVCDSKTLPWCRDNVLSKCELDQLVVLMNDWIDGGTADVAVQLSRQRLER